MKEEILSSLDNPAQLEQLYRTDKAAFRRAFNALYPTIRDHSLAGFWNERLHFGKETSVFPGRRSDLIFVVVASVLAGIMAKAPAFLHIDETFFYPRNLGFIIFVPLSAYFAWQQKLPASRIALIAGAFLTAFLFINLFPDARESDTLRLSCVHLLLFLWSLWGLTFVGKKAGDTEPRLGYLRYNGDLIVMTTLILIAGVILSGITIGLFQLIGLHIEKFYFSNIVVFALPAAPILGAYLTRTNPQLVGKVSPVIATLFSPLVLVMLLSYIAAIIYLGKDPYNDREFLLIFNALLVGVMAIIFFSVAETARGRHKRVQVWVLFLLSVATVIVSGVALSAILFRITTWGITPNRAAVLGSNVLILANLLYVSVQLFRALLKKTDMAEAGRAISRYLPVYCIWTIVVTFIFPLIFGFG